MYHFLRIMVSQPTAAHVYTTSFHHSSTNNTGWTQACMHMAINFPSVSFAASLFVLTLFCCQKDIDGKYISTGACLMENCLYAYSATQMSVVGESQAIFKVQADIESVCESVGEYKRLRASKFCAVLKNVVVDAERIDKASLKEPTDMANYLLSEPFCFVQTSDGKVVSVHYSPDEKPSIVNFKKAVAAAFQANFKYTEQEVEADTVTEHVSQYSYENLGPDHWIMRRTVHPSNIIRFASNELHGEKRLALQKSEVVEYKNGVLLRSSGTSSVNAKGPMVDAQDASVDGSDELFGTGTYSLVLKTCTPTPNKSRRSANRLHKTDNSLSALDDKAIEGKRDIEQMKNLRKQMPSVFPLLVSLHKNTTNTDIGYKIKSLLVMEHQMGPLPSHIPARDEVIDYLRTVLTSTDENDLKMRVLLYSFLAAEGSIESQKIIIKGINETNDPIERNTLTVHLAFVPNIHPDALSLIENIIKSSNDTTDPLILSYGALASSLSPQLQSRVIQFLHTRTDISDDVTTVHLIHAMGNTKSNLTDQHLIASLSHENPSVRLAAIYALRHRTGSPDVQYSLLRTLHSFPSKEVTDMTLRALIAGAEQSHIFGFAAVNDSFFEELLTATKDDVEQRAMLVHYVRLLGPSSPLPMVVSGQKRSLTENWKENNEEFDLVLNLDTRDNDVRSYPSHKAILWGKSIGKKIKLSAAFGAFAGFGAGTAEQPGGFKLFAKGVARGYAFGRSQTAFEALILSENKPGSDVIQNRVYLNILGKVLIDKSKTIHACLPWKIPLYQSGDLTLLDFNFKVFICVGFINFQVTVSIHLRLDAGLTVCITECVSGKATLTPTIGLSATAGATASLLEIMRGGIDVRANLNYALTVQLTGNYKLYQGPAEFCLALLHSWPDNNVEIYPYYQYKKLKWTDTGFFRIPTGFEWTEKKQWELLVVKFHLPGAPLRLLWSSRDPSALQCRITNVD